MQDEWWAELARVHGVLRDDPATWRQPAGDLKGAKRSALQHRIATERVRGAIDDLLGAGAWDPPRDWGRVLTTFPETGAWDVPDFLWHWDNPGGWHRERLNGLFAVSFIGEVAPRGGGTLILSGSPRLIMRQDETLPPRVGSDTGPARRELFHTLHPWLKALTGKGPSPADRVAAFMDAPTEIDGAPLRVVELTARPATWCSATPASCTAPRPTGAMRRASCASASS